MATECLKNCCKIFLRKDQESGIPAIKVMPVPIKAISAGQVPEGQKKMNRVSEDYLMSKLPMDGREVPFVVPTFRPSYVQPSGLHYPLYQEGLHNSAMRTYADRKAELSGSSHIVYNPSCSLQQSKLAELVSPGSARRVFPKNKTPGLHGSVWDLKTGKPHLSNSMMDLSHIQSHIQRYDSVSSVQSSTSSVRDSLGSSRSLESITLSGDERELGKLSIRLSYQEPLEQVWITLVQCKDLYFPMESEEQQTIEIKGIITIAKPVQFKSSIKEASQDIEFMETFVFVLPLKLLRAAALVLRLRTRLPRKRTLGECALSLRQLGPQEELHRLDVHQPSKGPICHAELHLATCFQAVNSRIQLQVLGAQNVPFSSKPLSQSFFVKVEMHSLGRLVAKKKSRAMKSSEGQVQWSETFLFPLIAQEHGVCFYAKLYSRSSVRRKHFLGQVHLGFESSSPEAMEQWNDTITHPEKVVSAWHKLSSN